MKIKRRNNTSDRAGQPNRRGRWLPYLLLACLMTFLARVPHQSHWRVAEYLDTFALDGCFERRGPLPVQHVVDKLYPSKDFILIELPYGPSLPLIADLVRLCKKAKVVAIDMMIVDRRAELLPADLPVFKNDLPHWQSETNQFADALKYSNNVVLGAWPELKQFPVPGKVNKTVTRLIWQHPTAAVWNAARWHAHLRADPSPEDGITRQVPLFQNTQTSPTAAAVRLPGLSLAVTGAVSNLSQQQLQQLKIKDGRIVVGKRTVAVPDDGSMTIDYLGTRESFGNSQISWRYSYALNECSESDFADKIVFLGRTDYKAKDDFTTPYGDMPGIHVHMHAAATLLGPNGPPLQLSLWQTTLIALAASILLLFPLLRLSLWGSLWAAELLCLLVFLGCFKLFVDYHRFFPVSVPLLAIALTYNGVALYEYGRARAALVRFVGRDVAGLMLNPLRDLSLGGQSQVATAFFCDLRGFSTAAERLTPETTEPFVNAYTEAVSTIAARFGGRTIDYFGDGVFVLFRQPGDDHALQAAHAALAVQEETRAIIGGFGERCDVPLEIAIGLNSGPMVIGVVGSQDHMKLGAVGDAVNVASRVQTLTGRCGYPILVTKECYDLINGQVPFTPCGHFEVKGREQTVEIYGAGPPLLPTAAAPHIVEAWT